MSYISAGGVPQLQLSATASGYNGSGGVLQASAISGSFSAYTTVVTNVSGTWAGNTNSSGITFSAGSWSNISGTGGGSITMTSGGDTVTAHLIDNTNSRIYRITAIYCSGTTSGYVAIERMC